MGSKYSRGSINPSISDLINNLELNELANIHRSFLRKSKSHYFVTKPLFYEIFPINWKNESYKTEAFEMFDPSKKAVASVIDIFGGIALLLDGDISAKFQFIFSLIKSNETNDEMNYCEYLIVFMGSSRGLSRIKSQITPSENTLRSLITQIYTQNNNFDLKRDLNIFNFINKARKIPDIIYYMYDLNSLRDNSLNIDRIIEEQRIVLEKIEKVNYDISIWENKNQDMFERIDSAIPNGKRVEKKRPIMTSKEITMLTIENIRKVMLESDKTPLMKKMKAFPLKSIEKLQTLFLKASTDLISIPNDVAKNAFNNLPKNQLNYIEVRNLINWFESYREKSSVLAEASSSIWISLFFPIQKYFENFFPNEFIEPKLAKNQDDLYDSDKEKPFVTTNSRKSKSTYSGSFTCGSNQINEGYYENVDQKWNSENKVSFDLHIYSLDQKEKTNTENVRNIIACLDSTTYSCFMNKNQLIFLLHQKTNKNELDKLCKTTQSLLNCINNLEIEPVFDLIEVDPLYLTPKEKKELESKVKMENISSSYMIKINLYRKGNIPSKLAELLNLFKTFKLSVKIKHSFQELWSISKKYEGNLYQESQSDNTLHLSLVGKKVIERMFQDLDLNQDNHLDAYELNHFLKKVDQPIISQEDIPNLLSLIKCDRCPPEKLVMDIQNFEKYFEAFPELENDSSYFDIGSLNDMLSFNGYFDMVLNDRPNKCTNKHNLNLSFINLFDFFKSFSGSDERYDDLFTSIHNSFKLRGGISKLFTNMREFFDQSNSNNNESYSGIIAHICEELHRFKMSWNNNLNEEKIEYALNLFIQFFTDAKTYVRGIHSIKIHNENKEANINFFGFVFPEYPRN